MRSFWQATVSGLLIGGIYALIALGLNIVFGTMRVVNFAQGALLMVGMFMVYWLWELGGVHPYLSPLVTLPALFGLGYLIQRTLVSPLLARERAREHGLARADLSRDHQESLALVHAVHQVRHGAAVAPAGEKKARVGAQLKRLGLELVISFVHEASEPHLKAREHGIFCVVGPAKV